GGGRPSSGSSSTSAGGSSSSTSPAAAPSTTPARRTPTSASCSRPVAARDASLREAAGAGVRVVVIGGGFIGSELAAALRSSGCAVTMVFPEGGIGGRLFPPALSEFVNAYYREQGVEVLPGELVEAVDGARLRLASGRTVEGDLVVAGIGIAPATELAEAAGLAVEDGIVVDVFAAGDVARFPAAALGTRLRVEHEDHANSHGRAVGANMAGAGVPYDHLPFFYSDLFEL